MPLSPLCCSDFGGPARFPLRTGLGPPSITGLSRGAVQPSSLCGQGCGGGAKSGPGSGQAWMVLEKPGSHFNRKKKKKSPNPRCGGGRAELLGNEKENNTSVSTAVTAWYPAAGFSDVISDSNDPELRSPTLRLASLLLLSGKARFQTLEQGLGGTSAFPASGPAAVIRLRRPLPLTQDFTVIAHKRDPS